MEYDKRVKYSIHFCAFFTRNVISLWPVGISAITKKSHARYKHVFVQVGQAVHVMVHCIPRLLLSHWQTTSRKKKNNVLLGNVLIYLIVSYSMNEICVLERVKTRTTYLADRNQRPNQFNFTLKRQEGKAVYFCLNSLPI